MALSMWMLSGLLVLAVAGGALGSNERDVLIDEAVGAIKPGLRGIVGLENINFSWSWRHWLVLHQDVNLTCRWGSVYPLEHLAKASSASELTPSGSGTRRLSAPLACPGLYFRYDNCVLLKGGDQEAEPLWGELSDTEFEVEVSLASSQGVCRATISKLALKEPKFNFNKDNGIVKQVTRKGYLSELSDTVRRQIHDQVTAELSKFIGQTYTLTRPC